MKKAIVLGASGFIGSYLLEDLLASPHYSEVIVVVRKSLNIQHAKLRVLIGDLNTISSLKKELFADEIFIALGTTKKQTPNEDEYYKIDHDYPVLAAKIAKENGAKAVFLVSAVGADAGSSVFYIRTKGLAERDIIALQFEHTHIFRPSMLMGDRKEHRPMEKAFMGLFSFLNPMLVGRASHYRGIDGKDVARAMVNAAKNQTEKVKIYHWEEMYSLLS